MQAIEHLHTTFSAAQPFQSFVELSDDRWQGAVRAAPAGAADSLVVSWEKPITVRGARGTRVVATSGDIWVTQSGRTEDHVLEVGNSVLLTEEEVVITAFSAGRVLLIPSSDAPTTPHAHPQWVRKLGAWYLRWMHRLAASGQVSRVRAGW